MKKILCVCLIVATCLFGNILMINANQTMSVVYRQSVTEITRNSAKLNMEFLSPVKFQTRFVWRQVGTEKWNDTHWVEKEREGTHTVLITGLNPDTDYEFKAEIEGIPTKEETVFFTKIYIEIQVDKVIEAGKEMGVCVRAEKGFVYVFQNDDIGATMVTTQREFFVYIVPTSGQNKITVKVGRHSHSVEFYADE